MGSAPSPPLGDTHSQQHGQTLTQETSVSPPLWVLTAPHPCPRKLSLQLRTENKPSSM